MILSAAQTKPYRGNINSNLKDHYRFIKIAAEEGVSLIAFPELSISGYELEDAHKYTFVENDKRLDKLRKLSADLNIIIIAGAPFKKDDEMYIGEFIFYPDGTDSIYTKQFLHTGEEKYYNASFSHNPLIELDNERISLAICADIDHPQHPENAAEIKTTIYIASIFFSLKGIPNAHELLKSYAQKHTMNILMSNFGGPSWGMEAGGRSAFWNNKGELISELNLSGSGLLIVDNSNGNWIGKTINVD